MSTAWASVMHLVVWAAVLVVSCLLGLLLSRLTLREVLNPPAEWPVVGKGAHVLHAIYNVVLMVVSLCYYLSIPFVVLTVVIVTGGIAYEMILGARVPFYLILLAGLGAVVLLYYLGSNVLVEFDDPAAGRALTKGEAPRLWSATDAVARRLNTRPVDRIVVTPGSEIAVTERGGTLAVLQGKAQRCLLLGLGALPGLRRGPFEALLAHEYGHFAGGGVAGFCRTIAYQARLSIYRITLKLIVNGGDKRYNPVWLFLAAFGPVFSHVVLGASRLRELLADRSAAEAFGVEDYIEGLEHSIRQSIVFSTQVAHEIELSQREGRRLRDVYTLPAPSDEDQLRKIERIFKEEMERSVSPDDSHPPPRDRIALLRRSDTGSHSEPDSELAWDLLANAGELRAEMTRYYQASVDDHRASMRPSDESATRAEDR